MPKNALHGATIEDVDDLYDEEEGGGACLVCYK
jgi:hypothetical protein